MAYINLSFADTTTPRGRLDASPVTPNVPSPKEHFSTSSACSTWTMALSPFRPEQSSNSARSSSDVNSTSSPSRCMLAPTLQHPRQRQFSSPPLDTSKRLHFHPPHTPPLHIHSSPNPLRKTT